MDKEKLKQNESKKICKGKKKGQRQCIFSFSEIAKGNILMSTATSVIDSTCF